MKKILALTTMASVSAVAFTQTAAAQVCSKPSCATQVPEINAYAGVAAVAVLAAVVALIWERRRAG